MPVLVHKAKKSVLPSGIESILFTKAQIAKRVKELARIIEKRYAGQDPVMIGILKGSFIFLSDLIREIRLPVEIDFLSVSSYTGTHSSGMVRLNFDIRKNIKHRSVILVDDIVDTGFSLGYVRKHLLARGPKSLEICVLLDKPERRRVLVPVNYLGFSVPDRFVVGYGLDYNERHRELPYIAVLKANHGV